MAVAFGGILHQNLEEGAAGVLEVTDHFFFPPF